MAEMLRVGAFEVIALADGAADLQGWAVSPELTDGVPVDWAAYAARNPGGFHGKDHRWRIHNTCYLVRGEGAAVLVDCGVGAGPYPWYGGLRGQLPRELAAAGTAPGDISTVFLTHAHPDHVGWTFDEEAGRPTFPRARYLLHRDDWDEFRGRTPVPKHFTRFVAPLERAGVLRVLDGAEEIAPGITAIETPGHTPGHMSLVVTSRGEGLVIAGDVLNSPVYVSEPGRPFGADMDRARGIATREALVARVEAEGWRVAAAHFPEPGWGSILRIEGRRWFAPGA